MNIYIWIYIICAYITAMCFADNGGGIYIGFWDKVFELFACTILGMLFPVVLLALLARKLHEAITSFVKKSAGCSNCKNYEKEKRCNNG